MLDRLKEKIENAFKACYPKSFKLVVTHECEDKDGISEDYVVIDYEIYNEFNTKIISFAYDNSVGMFFAQSFNNTLLFVDEMKCWIDFVEEVDN